MVRYYYQHPDGRQDSLGTDYQVALDQWREMQRNPVNGGPADGWSNVTKDFRTQYVRTNRLKPKTRKEYEAQLDRLDAVFQNTPLPMIKPAVIGKMKWELQDKPAMFNRLKGLISNVYNWARETGRTEALNPCIGVRGHREEPGRVVVTDEMYRAVYDKGDQVVRDWMRLTLTAGSRVSDVLLIRRENLQIDNGKRWLVPPNSKTNRSSWIEVIDDLHTVVEELLSRPRQAIGPYLIQTDNGQHVTYYMLRKRWDAAYALARTIWEESGREWIKFERRDMRAKSSTDDDSLEEAQKRLAHTDARTTSRHYKRKVRAKPGRMPNY